MLSRCLLLSVCILKTAHCFCVCPRWCWQVLYPLLLLLMPVPRPRCAAGAADDVYTVQELWTRGRAAPGSWCLWPRPGSWSPTTSYPFRFSITTYIMLFFPVAIVPIFSLCDPDSHIVGNLRSKYPQKTKKGNNIFWAGNCTWRMGLSLLSAGPWLIAGLKQKHTPCSFLVFHCKLSASCWVLDTLCITLKELSRQMDWDIVDICGHFEKIGTSGKKLFIHRC